MSLSSLMLATAQGNDDWVGIPIFTTRKFFHTDIFVRKDAGINTPADLKGKRAGVPEYQQTAALWIRAVLQHEFGVHPSEMEHWMERLPTHSHAGGTTGGATALNPPPGITIKQIPIEKSIGSMMVAGEIDAVSHYYDHKREPKTLERSTVDLRNHPDVKMLFPDPIAEGIRFYRKSGIFPINHGMAIRRELAETISVDPAQSGQGLQQGQRDREPPAHRARAISRLGGNDLAGRSEGAARDRPAAWRQGEPQDA